VTQNRASNLAGVQHCVKATQDSGRHQHVPLNAGVIGVLPCFQSIVIVHVQECAGVRPNVKICQAYNGAGVNDDIIAY
jgi:hypothetical protein